MHTNLFAYTAPGLEPEFISLNRHDDGRIVLTARSPTKDRQLGVTIDVPLPDDELPRLADALAGFSAKSNIEADIAALRQAIEAEDQKAAIVACLSLLARALSDLHRIASPPA